METIKIFMVARVEGRERRVGRAQRIFRAVKLLCIIL